MIWREFRKRPVSSFKTGTVSEEVTCPRCGFDIDLWNACDETACSFCGYLLFSHEKTVN